MRVCDDISELLQKAINILGVMTTEEEEAFMKELQMRSGDARRSAPVKMADALALRTNTEDSSSHDVSSDIEEGVSRPGDRKKTVAVDGGEDVKKFKRSKKRGVTLEDELFAAPVEVVAPESEEQLKYKRKVEDEIISSEEVLSPSHCYFPI